VDDVWVWSQRAGAVAVSLILLSVWLPFITFLCVFHGTVAYCRARIYVTRLYLKESGHNAATRQSP
jgi:hypothetical protein